MDKFLKRILIIFLLGLCALVFSIFNVSNSGVVIWVIAVHVFFVSGICVTLSDNQEKMMKAIEKYRKWILESEEELKLLEVED